MAASQARVQALFRTLLQALLPAEANVLASQNLSQAKLTVEAYVVTPQTLWQVLLPVVGNKAEHKDKCGGLPGQAACQRLCGSLTDPAAIMAASQAKQNAKRTKVPLKAEAYVLAFQTVSSQVAHRSRNGRLQDLVASHTHYKPCSSFRQCPKPCSSPKPCLCLKPCSSPRPSPCPQPHSSPRSCPCPRPFPCLTPCSRPCYMPCLGHPTEQSSLHFYTCFQTSDVA